MRKIGRRGGRPRPGAGVVFTGMGVFVFLAGCAVLAPSASRAEIVIDVPEGAVLTTNGEVTVSEDVVKTGGGTLVFDGAEWDFGGARFYAREGGVRVKGSTLRNLGERLELGHPDVRKNAFTFESGTISIRDQFLIGVCGTSTEALQAGGDLNASVFYLGGWGDAGNVGGSRLSTYTQQGGTVTLNDLHFSGWGPNGGTYRLDGGVLTVGRVLQSSKGEQPVDSVLRLGGGTLAAKRDEPNWIAADLTGLELAADSVIDTGVFSVGIPRGFTGGGGLVKRGAGVLTFAADQAYTGATAVEGGSLVFNGAAASSNFTVAAGASLRLDGAVASSPSFTVADNASLSLGPAARGSVLGGITFNGITFNGPAALALPGARELPLRAGAVAIHAGVLTVDIRDSDGGAAHLPAGTHTLVSCESLTVGEGASVALAGLAGELEGEAGLDTANGLITVTVAPPAGVSWTGGAGDGKWSAGGNWSGGAASGGGADVFFPTIAGAAEQTVEIDAAAALTVGRLVFSSDTAYALTGGSIALSLLESLYGSHSVSSALAPAGEGGLTLRAAKGQSLTATGKLTGTAPVLVTGGGAVAMENVESTFEGDLTVSNAQLKVSGTIPELNPARGTLGNMQKEGREIRICGGAAVTFTGSDIFGNVRDSSSEPSVPSRPKGTIRIGPDGTLASSHAFSSLDNVVLEGGTIYGGPPLNDQYHSFLLCGDVRVTGSAPSTIGSDPNGVIHLDSPCTTFTVEDVTGDGGGDLNVPAQLADKCSWSPIEYRRAGWVKRGPGTMTLSERNWNTGTNYALEGAVDIPLARNFNDHTATAWGMMNEGATVISNAVVTVRANDTLGSIYADIRHAVILDRGGTLTSDGGRFNTLGPLVLRGGTLSGNGICHENYETWNWTKPVTVAGGTPSFIRASGNGIGINISADVALDVADITGNDEPDLVIDASAAFVGRVNLAPADISPDALVKTGPGTVLCDSRHRFTGPLVVSNGTWIVNAQAKEWNPAATGFGSSQSEKPVTVEAGALLRVTRCDALGSAKSDIRRPLVIRGEVRNESCFSTLGPVALEGGTLGATRGFDHSVYGPLFQVWQFTKPVTVGGASPSFITVAIKENPGIHMKGGETPFIVGDATADAAVDLTVDAVVRGLSGSMEGGEGDTLVKRGAGTMRLLDACVCRGGISVEEGAFLMDGANAHAAAVSAGAMIGGRGRLDGGLLVAEGGGFLRLHEEGDEGCLDVAGDFALPAAGRVRVEGLARGKSLYPLVRPAAFSNAGALGGWEVTGRDGEGKEREGMAVIRHGALCACFPSGTAIILR